MSDDANSDANSIGQADFNNLLELQICDSEIDKLALRHETLPAQQALNDIQTRAVGLRPRLMDATAKRDEQTGRLATIEAEVQATESRIAEINSRLYGGQNVTPRDAQAMATEVKHLNERKSKLEDQELELMEIVEPLRLAVQQLEVEAQGLAQELQSVQQQLQLGKLELDNELATWATKREGIKSSLPSALISEYERLRPSLGGVAVAAVVGSSCGGCHLSFSSSELDKIRKAPLGNIIYCEECGRILIRKAS